MRTAAAVACVLACSAGRAHADTERFTLHLGFPELVGAGFGHAVGCWHLQADVGVILFANSLTLGVQRELIRTRKVAFGVGVHGTGIWIPPLIGEDPDSRGDIGGGPRVVLEVDQGGPGDGYAIEAGVYYWREPGTFDRESHFQPTITLRFGGSWLRDRPTYVVDRSVTSRPVVMNSRP